jgi:hypothetical protein
VTSSAVLHAVRVDGTPANVSASVQAAVTSCALVAPAACSTIAVGSSALPLHMQATLATGATFCTSAPGEVFALPDCNHNDTDAITADSTALALEQQMLELNISLAQTSHLWPVRAIQIVWRCTTGLSADAMRRTKQAARRHATCA